MIIVLWQSVAYQMTCTLMNNLYFANYKDNSDMLTSHENLYFLNHRLPIERKAEA